MAIDFTNRDPVEEATCMVNEMTDDQLNKFVDFIREEMKDRARRRNRLAKASLNVGNKVIIAGKMKPAYLTGLTGVVEDIRQTRVTVKLDKGPVGKFRSGKVVINPSALQVIS